ncbi:MAG: hypothetical protein HC851_11335 [Acaryochloris sp. RU_4_1]|nr:hypothetical protein [Acaryochloris sp. RU_4_1]NJR57185.1 hypothetical protein [Acaryochloris sp. CRU_2_0]
MKQESSKKKPLANESVEKARNLLYKSLEDVRVLHAEKIRDELAQKKGLVAYLRYFLFTKPFRTNFVISSFAFICFLLVAIVVKAVNNIWISLIYVLLVVIVWATLTIFIYVITPKPDIKYDKRWSDVVSSILSRSTEISKTREELTLKELKQILKRAIRYYHRNGEPLKFLLNLFWGGIFVGCLPDSNFQEAMIEAFSTLQPMIIWNQNKFGALCLLFVPFLSLIYHFRYGLPKVWLEHVLFQIEVEE